MSKSLATMMPFVMVFAACRPASSITSPGESGYGFDPFFKNITVVLTEDGFLSLPRPVPAKDLAIVDSNGQGGLEWKLPPTYFADGMKTGYLIYAKSPDLLTGKITWSWAPSSEDWERQVGKAEVTKACSAKTLRCRFSSPGLSGRLGIAVFTKWDIEVPIVPSGLKEIVDISLSDASLTEGLLKSPTTVVALGSEFIDRFVSVIGGPTRGRSATSSFSLLTSVLPSFLIERGQRIAKQLTTPYVFSYENSKELIAASERPFHVARSNFNPGTKFLFPDFGKSRALVTLDANSFTVCNNDPDPLGCYTRSGVQNSSLVMGQTSVSSNQGAGPIRSFTSGSISHAIGKSGQSYTFVADRARILVRVGEFFGCPEIEATSEDAGRCGFQYSIGTRSPRMMFPEPPPSFNHLSYRLSIVNNPYFGARYASGDLCLSWSLECYLRDDVPLTNSSLRLPSAPYLHDGTLYIPDTGNARVVTIKDFELKLQTCGRLKPLIEIPDQACSFDRVLGPPNFTERNCIRGGERFRSLETNSSVAYPSQGLYGLIGSVACRSDQLLSTVESRRAQNLFDRDVNVVDFGDSILSDLSVSGALTDRAKQTFRAPTKVRIDNTGRLYVMDNGYTYVTLGANAATLPPRLMIWSANPFVGELPCVADSCAADYTVGPPAAQSTFVHKASEELWHTFWPSGGFPISDFEIIASGSGAGLWFVTGVDPRLVRVAEPSKLSLIYNPAIFTEYNARKLPFYDEPTHRRGSLSGLSVTPDGTMLLASDPLQNVFFSWLLQGISLK